MTDLLRSTNLLGPHEMRPVLVSDLFPDPRDIMRGKPVREADPTVFLICEGKRWQGEARIIKVN